ncbi:hypothetical protein CTI12_AA363850 [Artemisia annua]|uniref:Peptidase C1A papain C-terminal domain-containing protein n=1 Tax=Artemisia annua TaxID=35608 RepID=A0A2U1MMF0_ARTAN|nr:hypothetical protein CTI12_AA363850 [Artemisia annua]
MADMTGTVLRMSGGDEFQGLYLSCMPMVDAKVNTVGRAIEFCTKPHLGLETTKSYPYERLGRGIPNWSEKHYQMKQRYRISSIVRVADKEEYKQKLLENYGDEGQSFPCVAMLRMGDFKDNLVARRCALENDPYHHPQEPTSDEQAVELYGEEHAVLIVGINTTSENTLKHYCEVKNTYGEEWGDKGFSKVGFEVFDYVLFPRL